MKFMTIIRTLTMWAARHGTAPRGTPRGLPIPFGAEDPDSISLHRRSVRHDVNVSSASGSVGGWVGPASVKRRRHRLDYSLKDWNRIDSGEKTYRVGADVSVKYTPGAPGIMYSFHLDAGS